MKKIIALLLVAVMALSLVACSNGTTDATDDFKVGAIYINSKNDTAGYGTLPEIWEAIMGAWTIEDGKVTEVQLYPISLGMKKPRPQKGVPVLSGDEKFLARLAELSKPYGTNIEIKDGVGYIRMK